jgi:hypothetical protein
MIRHNYVDKKQNEQSNALDLLSAYLADGKLNSRQAMIIQHAIKHLGAVYTIEGHKISQNIGGNITAPATTLPTKQPRPTSSTPTIIIGTL